MRWWLSLALMLCVCGRARAEVAVAAGTNFTADEVIARLIERARTATNRLAVSRVAFLRRTTIEELDRRGQVRERTTKEHNVELNGHDQTVRLVKLNGRPLTGQEEADERSREEENRRRFAERRDRVRSGTRDFVDEKLIRRFRYELERREDVAGRPTYVLQFFPLAPPEDGPMADRILARLAGRVWIDAADFELARVEARLQRPLRFWGGLVGSLDELDFDLTRVRLADGTWVNATLGSHAAGCKAVVPFRARMAVEQEDFRPLREP